MRLEARFTPVAVIALILCAAPSASAQTITGTITGIVKDASGGVLPGVTITMTHLQTSRPATAVTDAEGRYTSAPLSLGDYRIEAALSGFKGAARSGITLTISDVARVDFTLEVGAVSEIVEVAAHASLVDANTSAVGKLVDNRRIAELPLNTRNVYALIFLTPGVGGTIGNAYGDLRYTINGARPRSSDTLWTASPPRFQRSPAVSASRCSPRWMRFRNSRSSAPRIPRSSGGASAAS
ncbi:MAG: carboxypeptidase-like regulatory domain-containing protein [Vicinamibacterales bacterium]